MCQLICTCNCLNEQTLEVLILYSIHFIIKVLYCIYIEKINRKFDHSQVNIKVNRPLISVQRRFMICFCFVSVTVCRFHQSHQMEQFLILLHSGNQRKRPGTSQPMPSTWPFFTPHYNQCASIQLLFPSFISSSCSKKHLYLEFVLKQKYNKYD